MSKQTKRLRHGKKGGKGRRVPEVVGTLSISRRGFGFCVTPEEEWFIPKDGIRGAMHGDDVAIRPSSRADGTRRWGRVVRVLRRNTSHVQGRYVEEDGFGVVCPIDPRIRFDLFIPREGNIEDGQGAEDGPHPQGGDIVDAAIVTYPSRRETAVGKVLRIIGQKGDKDLDYKLCVASHELEVEFPDDALRQARECALDVDSALAEPDRKDLRGEHIFTIDPADAKDFDDAVSALENPDGSFTLGVHIADVSHYVAFSSPIDRAARSRATSTYLAQGVVPMLPERLCNDLCSLVPDDDRLAFSVRMRIDGRGEIVKAEFFPSVIKSRLRLDYDRADAFLEGSLAWPDEKTRDAVLTLRKLADIRARRRKGRGGIDFDGVELKVRLDDEGEPLEILLKRRTQATGLIEEAMICANEAVASYLEDKGVPCAYRVHDMPSTDSLSAIVPLLEELGYPTQGLAQGNPHAIQGVLDRARKRPEKEMVENKVLRSMKRAVYSPENRGHFGLASKAYCHFTSPIRRYPDLMVHRLLRATLLGVFDKKGNIRQAKLDAAAKTTSGAVCGIDEMAGQMEWLCKHSSQQERNSSEAAWDSVWVKILQFMQRHVGQRFPAIISHCTTRGATAMLENTVRGFIPAKDLGDERFDYDPLRDRLTGSDSGRVWQAGKRVYVRLEQIDEEEMCIVFSPAKKP